MTHVKGDFFQFKFDPGPSVHHIWICVCLSQNRNAGFNKKKQFCTNTLYFRTTDLIRKQQSLTCQCKRGNKNSFWFAKDMKELENNFLPHSGCSLSCLCQSGSGKSTPTHSLVLDILHLAWINEGLGTHKVDNGPSLSPSEQVTTQGLKLQNRP